MQFKTLALFVACVVAYASCQSSDSTVESTLPVAATTPASGCADAATNCAGIAQYCFNANYAQLMLTNCLKTCYKCVAPVKNTACKDSSSNCNISLCNNALWKDLYAKNCKSTCNKC
uniref:ShKT domain-containing protein n=1 Tax=Rhabditophanes sp. KR3021 TaxID=114890 RepID=A0AC35TJ38_9BILA